jgi:hypothetical protein
MRFAGKDTGEPWKLAPVRVNFITRVGAIHDFLVGEFLFQNGAADLDAFQRLGGRRDFFVMAGDGSQLFYREG